MDPAVIVSPHLDDAVLSCGQLMAGRADMVVVTVMAGLPAPTVPATTFDRHCGFSSAREAVEARRLEDQDALAALNARPMFLPMLDGQYRPTPTQDGFAALVEEAAQLIAMAVANADAHLMFGPLGLAHPDHEIASCAFVQVARSLDVEAWLYEELPARVLWPEQVPRRLAAVAAGGGQLVAGFPGTGMREAKERAMRCYRSQLWALDEPCYLVPERYWRLWL